MEAFNFHIYYGEENKQMVIVAESFEDALTCAELYNISRRSINSISKKPIIVHLPGYGK